MKLQETKQCGDHIQKEYLNITMKYIVNFIEIYLQTHYMFRLKYVILLPDKLNTKINSSINSYINHILQLLHTNDWNSSCTGIELPQI